MQSRIMFIESKSRGIWGGEAHIGRVRYSKTGRTIYYRGQSFQSLGGAGFKANYYNIATGDQYWISGPCRRGCDRLYCERVPITIDADVWDEYWPTIRGVKHMVEPHGIYRRG